MADPPYRATVMPPGSSLDQWRHQKAFVTLPKRVIHDSVGVKSTRNRVRNYRTDAVMITAGAAASRLAEVGRQLRPLGFRYHRHVPVIRVIEAQHHLGVRRRERRDLFHGELEMHELH